MMYKGFFAFAFRICVGLFDRLWRPEAKWITHSPNGKKMHPYRVESEIRAAETRCFVEN